MRHPGALAGARRRSGRPRPNELAHGSPSAGMWRSLLDGRPASWADEAARPGQPADGAAGADGAPVECGGGSGAPWAPAAARSSARRVREGQVGTDVLGGAAGHEGLLPGGCHAGPRTFGWRKR